MTASHDSRKPPILVLNNDSSSWAPLDQEVSNAMVDLMLNGLREEGYTYELVTFFADLSVLDRYDPHEWLIWNWGEELAGEPWSEAVVVAELERRGFAFTGASSEVLRFAQNRPRVKERLRALGLPTLPWRVFDDPAQAAEWTHYPAIVKGANQHASYGITGDSVTFSPDELARAIEAVRDTLKDQALVEPFLDTREFQVAVWGNDRLEVLPPVEYDFSKMSGPHERLYTYEAKFDRSSRAYKDIGTVCPAPADRPDWEARLREVAEATYRALGLRDYGRLDLRMLGDEPQILDVNPNPDLDPTSVLPIGCQALGLTYGQMVSRILQHAVHRMPARD
jgi:D-alanine-D-alanine ligase